jgi:hypothetical protein
VDDAQHLVVRLKVEGVSQPKLGNTVRTSQLSGTFIFLTKRLLEQFLCYCSPTCFHLFAIIALTYYDELNIGYNTFSCSFQSFHNAFWR